MILIVIVRFNCTRVRPETTKLFGHFTLLRPDLVFGANGFRIGLSFPLFPLTNLKANCCLAEHVMESGLSLISITTIIKIAQKQFILVSDGLLTV